MQVDLIHSLVNISPERPWGIMIVNYFFLTGISAASFIIANLYFVFKKSAFKSFSFFALLISFSFLIVAPLNLIDDLSKPSNLLSVFFYGWENFFTSPMKWGVLLLISYFFISLMQLFFLCKKNNFQYEKNIFYLGILGIILAIAIEFYTAYLIAILNSFIFTHTALMPVLFLASALFSASATLIILLVLYESFYLKQKLSITNYITLIKFLALCACIDFILKIFWFSFLFLFNTQSQELLQIFLKKESFMLFFVDMGLCLLLPIFIAFKFYNNIFMILIAALLSLIGTFIFRYNLIIKTQSFPKQTTSFLKYHLDLSSFISIASNYALLLALFCFVLAIFDKNILKGK
ncbi:NrfD/PsrC family molybdoenzyme membrane anchor subunit [Campylobacter canadensis]|uniref:Polysulfide reductase NrfD n=1 Tax=Campylobacter canadensis TaxID=449520 RepID=A0ABS7WSA1_9BACT|nr:NrfD/PsrC family molybdoenzyme membrane anchor subunit [Campylobacter canadensis]MBZ7987623.1 polysulfide reductase NrfD [Campylobacter canadensis]MBZ7996908.1 polysulfide reductase NrfD [Campylobacter canadensis]MBZ7998731.1 polysulfide reductase NrfD [Campylobacter canadensis]MBZ8000387.1 polysulfide reductase NrfD [Campylobacter canadensis]MBZ8002188.1 polysulfide reductase NrfD [Campylobacter canadensis]